MINTSGGAFCLNVPSLWAVRLLASGPSCPVLCCPHALPLLSLPDVNECEMSLALCGGFPCENVDGSFLCICTNDNEEFDPVTNQCRSRGNRTGLELTGTHGR